MTRYLDVDLCGNYLATAGDDASLTVRRMTDLSWHGSYYEFDSAVRSIGFSHDASFLAFATDDEYIEIIEVTPLVTSHMYVFVYLIHKKIAHGIYKTPTIIRTYKCVCDRVEFFSINVCLLICKLPFAQVNTILQCL